MLKKAKKKTKSGGGVSLYITQLTPWNDDLPSQGAKFKAAACVYDATGDLLSLGMFL